MLPDGFLEALPGVILPGRGRQDPRVLHSPFPQKKEKKKGGPGVQVGPTKWMVVSTTWGTGEPTKEAESGGVAEQVEARGARP